jgi:hypothetical protein
MERQKEKRCLVYPKGFAQTEVNDILEKQNTNF